MDYLEGLVSVILPTYKRSIKLERAIESVLNQTYQNLELFLVNDNDNEDSFTKDLLKRVEKYKTDSRFHLVFQDRHRNGAVARNVGIKLSRGEYIAFLDDDDWWKQNKIERQVDVLNKLDSSWGAVSCKYVLYDDQNRVVRKTKKYRSGLIYKDILRLTTDVATSTLLVRRKALDESGLFDEDLLRHQDLQLLVCLTSKFKLLQINEYLHCCDISDAQNRLNGDKLIEAKAAFFKSVDKQMKMLTKSEQRCIYAMNDFEVGYVFLKNKEFRKGFRYILHVFKSPHAFLLTIKKVFGRLFR